MAQVYKKAKLPLILPLSRGISPQLRGAVLKTHVWAEREAKPHQLRMLDTEFTPTVDVWILFAPTF